MYSRAHLLIEKDHQALLEDDLWGIEAHPLTEESIFTWTAKIHGVPGTDWEGGVLRLYIKFDEHYKYRPPLVCFHTIPFHPNVDPITGRPCLTFLDDPDEWRDTITISYILTSIQNLLSNPVLTQAVNTEALEMLENDPVRYRRVVRDCVLTSQRVEAGVEPHRVVLSRSGARSKNGDSPECKPLNNQPVHRLNFTDYHRTWAGIATSKPRSDLTNPLIDLIQSDPVLERIHCRLSPEELQAQMARQLESHNALMYGKFDNQKQPKDEQQVKLAKIEKMRKIYLPQKREISSVSPAPDSTRRQNTITFDDDVMDREADDLLNWTAKLDAEQL